MSDTTLVASDWHLGRYSEPSAARLAIAFLERARASRHRVILNGDIFEAMYEPLRSAEAAHPELVRLIGAMQWNGQLRRTEGNHDPGSGARGIVIAHARLGPVLITHGHGIDPLHGGPLGRFGDAVSHNFGRFAVVRAAARLTEASTMRVLGDRIDERFRAYCRGVLDRRGCAFGVFGHIHRAYLAPGDPYANAGRLSRDRLEYLALTPDGAELRVLTLDELAPGEGERAGAR